MILEIYTLIGLIFLIVTIFRIESACLDLFASRSRETKSLLRVKIKRNFKDIFLAIVWPVRVWKVLSVTYKIQKQEKILKIGKE